MTTIDEACLAAADASINPGLRRASRADAGRSLPGGCPALHGPLRLGEEGPLSVSFAICGLALVIEALVGYPPALFGTIGHPVTWIGAGLAWADARFNRETASAPARRRAGAMAFGVVVLGAVLAAALLQAAVFALVPPAAALLVVACLASTCLAQRSLDAHVRAVADALETGGDAAGRRAVARIVGRDVGDLDAGGVALAAIESLAESFADGVVAPALWLALLGLPGVVALKAVNTADSMIGHRTPRHAAFGFAAAKTDDVVIWPAARLAALLLAAAAALLPGASAAGAWRTARRDARGSPSPNAGWPEAAMAGALGLRLGGPRRYGEEIVEAAAMGDGRPAAGAADIRRALALSRVACGLEIALVVGLAALIARA